MPSRGHKDIQYSQTLTRDIAPDGTVIHSNEQYIQDANVLLSGETIEVPIAIQRDDRTVEINVRLEDGM